MRRRVFALSALDSLTRFIPGRWPRLSHFAPLALVRHMEPKTSRWWLLVGLLLLAAGIGAAQEPELVVQTGHSGWVYSVAFSPDGKLLASGSSDQTIKLWDAATGTELRSLRGHTYNVEAVVFSRDGKLLVSLSGGNEIKIWNLPQGTLARTIRPTDYANTIAISPGGDTIASGDNRGRIRLWNTNDGREARVLQSTASRINSVAFSPDRRFLVSGGDDFVINIWDVRSGLALHTIKDQAYGVTGVAFNPDGLTVATGAGNAVRLWDVASGREIRSFNNGSRVTAVSFSPDGQTLASGSYSGTLTLWNVATGVKLQTLTGHASEVRSAAFSPDGKLIASGSTDRTIKLWDARSGSSLRTLSGHSTAVFSVAFVRDGKTMLAGSIDNTVKLWDLATGELRNLTGHSAEILSLAFSPDGRTLASGSADRSIKLWDVGSGSKLQDLKWDSMIVGSVAFSPDGAVIAGGSDDHKITLWNASTGAELRRLTAHSTSVNSVAFSPDGKLLATGSFREVKLWDTETGEQLRLLPGHFNNVNTVRFSPDGKTLASDSFSELFIWDVATGTKLQTLKARNNEICTFSADSKRIFSGAGYSDIVEWDLKTGAELRRFKGHTFSPLTLSFSPDGKVMASGSVDNTIRLWDLANGSELRVLPAHSGHVQTVSFSLDGRTLISAGDDRLVKLWNWASGEELLTQVVLDDQDWAVIAPDGLFDGSAAAWRRIIWRFPDGDKDFVPVEVFFDEFFYPELLPDIMAGKRPKASRKVSAKDRRQPEVHLTAVRADSGSEAATTGERKIGIKLTVAEIPPSRDNKTGSGARDVRLFRNGSLVKVWYGDVFKLGAVDGCKIERERAVVCETPVTVVAGENRLTAYAFNRDGVKSSDAALTINGAAGLKRASTLHVLAIGVGRYANPDYDLNYAAKDAEEFAAEVRSQQEKLKRFDRVEVKKLLDHGGTKRNVLAELARLAGKVQPEDGVVVFFSGHGAAERDRFYLIPHDLGYTGSRRDLGAAGLKAVLDHSISDLELEAAFRYIDAGQFLLVIDACNSGQALESDEKRRGPMNSKGLAQLAYEKGMYVLTAAQSYEVAYESETLKHSYLTFALVGGLQTAAADREPADGEVTLREWLGYATREVPRLRRERVGRLGQKELVEIIREQQKVQQPRVFYRREREATPLVVARTGVTKPVP